MYLWFGRNFCLILLTINLCSCKSTVDPMPELKDQGTFTIPNSIRVQDLNPVDTAKMMEPGMIYVPGGKLDLSDPKTGQSTSVVVHAFLMDSTEVTVADFRNFVRATNFKTDAEKFGNAAVFDMGTRTWGLVEGANWEYPQGINTKLAEDSEPVTQLSWFDAKAYCKWKNKRLPDEMEWEHAARNGSNDQMDYSWGNDWVTDDKINGNVWQGEFPVSFKNLDGFESVAPVGSFRASPLGFKDLSGNVWEWCDNWRFDYDQLSSGIFDLSTEKAMRGGSFLCAPNYCHGYKISSRSFTTPETSLFHLGCRCAKDVQPSK